MICRKFRRVKLIHLFSVKYKKYILSRTPVRNSSLSLEVFETPGWIHEAVKKIKQTSLKHNIYIIGALNKQSKEKKISKKNSLNPK